ncbi:hypothetical protein [Geomesophilobacter sediminis]|uniref:Lipoprotein n=1 Tax=Geomesophilobacter sediminis TaxID=2798584 RepID=A0A8J7IVR1_9BACT|nr:hypothetical protein [Geomesophilobacter sediminis]MBJ6723317.1 hypothetical protein [Geomesophilobacter sediminis]
MKKALLLLLVGTALIAGCGGGGGVADAPTPTIEVATRAALSSTVVYGVELTVQLPAGVTVAADATGAVADGVIVPKVAGTLVGGRYVAAGASTPATVTIIASNAAGLTVGELVNVACQVSPGATPTAAAFTVTHFSAWAVVGNDTVPIEGVTPALGYAVL